MPRWSFRSRASSWTVVSSIIAITLGILENSAVLVAFGAIGCVDAIGSLALVHHFRHGLRNDELSDHLELVAHRVVLVGLLVVGCAAIIGGAVRLALGQSGEGATPAVVLASVSLVVLLVLAQRKRSIARRVSSDALAVRCAPLLDRRCSSGGRSPRHRDHAVVRLGLRRCRRNDHRGLCRGVTGDPPSASLGPAARRSPIKQAVRRGSRDTTP